MKTCAKFVLFLGMLCLPVICYAQGFSSLDACGYDNADTHCKIYYKKVRTHYEWYIGGWQPTKEDDIYIYAPSASGSYRRIKRDTYVHIVDPEYEIDEVIEGHYSGNLGTYQTPGVPPLYECGKYDDVYSVGYLLNRYLDGEDVSDFWGTDTYTTVEESHSATGYSYTIDAAYTGSDPDPLFSPSTTTYRLSLDGAFTSPVDVNDGQDHGKNGTCHGMPSWYVTEPYINLWIKDIPVHYTTSLGKPIDFEVSYKQRDTRPNDTSVPLTGWSHNWFSYVRFMVPTYAILTDSENINIVGTSARGVAVRANWTLTNDFGQWSAILYAPDDGENYFDHNAKAEARSGLTLLPMDGVDAHIYPNSTENPAGVTNLYGKVGFRLVHPDGSQDIYGLVSGLQPIWGKANLGVRTGILARAPGDVTTTYSDDWSTNDPSLYSYEDYSPPTDPVSYLAGDALLTERIDPYGNSTHLIYTDTGTNYLLKNIVDYDWNVTTLSYGNGLLTNVDMPYGKSASFGYTDGRLTRITDAEKMTSYVSYSPFGTNVFETSTNFFATGLSTPYGSTSFAHTEANFFMNLSNPPALHMVHATYNSETGEASYTANIVGSVPIYLGRAGGTNRINRACQITNPDGSKEVYVYRYDSSSLVPSNYPSSQVPSIVSDDGRPHDGVSSQAPMDAWLSTRNSFHWNRQQAALISTTNLNALTSSDMAVATMSHWLADDDNTISESVSLIRAASPDGSQEGQKTWFQYSNKPDVWKSSTDYGSAIAAQLMPDGSESSIQTSYNNGVPTAITETYTTPEGALGTRSYSYDYSTVTASETCSLDSVPVQWSYLLLSSISTPAGQWTLSNPSDVTTTRTDGGYTFTTVRPRRLQLEVTDPVENTTTNFYNSRQQLTGIKRANGLTTSNIYDEYGFLAKSIDIESKSTNTFSFANGLLSTSTSPLGLGLSYAWDKLDRLTRVSFPDGTTVSNKYDKLDAVGHKDRLNHWTYAQYDSMRQLEYSVDARTNTTYYDWCLCGALASITDPLSHTTSFTRDNNGNVITASSSVDSSSTTYHRNILGQVTNVTSSDSLNLKYAYNIQGLVTDISNPAGTVFAAVYDASDLPLHITDSRGVTVTNTYDALGRILTSLDPLWNTETFVYSAQGLAQHYDALSQLTSYGYDPAGRLFAVTNANLEVVQVGYDAAGDIVSLADGRSNTKHWRFDIYGRTIGETNANGILIKTNGYDVNGRLTASWTPAKGLTQFGYDNNGNPTSITYPHSSSVSYGYDALNRLVSFSDAVGSSSLVYASFGAFAGALASEDGPWSSDTVSYGHTGHKLTSVGIGSWNESISYDSSLRPYVFSSTAGTFTYHLNGAGMQVGSLDMPGSVTVYDDYDAAGALRQTQLKKNSTVLDSHAYGYDVSGLITSVGRLGAVTNTYGYDAIGQLMSAQARESNGSLRKNEDFGYGYDASGNLRYRTNHTLIQTFGSDKVNALTNILRNDALTVSGNVTGAVASISVNFQPTEIYSDGTFASASGLTLANGYNKFVTRATNNSGALVMVAVTTNTLPASVKLTNDLNGNLLSDGRRGLEYDDANQLVRVTVTNGWKTEFAYDGLGRRRITKEYSWNGSSWTQTNEVRYVWDGMVVMQERDSGNNVRVTYTRGLDLSGSRQGAGGIGGMLARTDANGSAFYHADGNGNITMMIDSSGNQKAKYLYDSFGNALGAWGSLSAANTYRFSSKELDVRSGLYYYGYRYYEPNFQRWLNQDPIGENGGINLYGFVGNNPNYWVDPIGYAWVSGGGPLNPKGPFAYQSSDTLLGNVGAGMYNVLPFIGNLFSRFSDTVNSTGNAAFEGVNWGIDKFGTDFLGEPAFGDWVRTGMPEFGWGRGIGNDTGGLKKPGQISKCPVVIGQNMKGRVEPFAKEWGFETYKPSRWFDNPADLNAENMEWINKVMDQGRPIFNIGPDPSLPPSIPLQNELNEIYRRSYPVNSFEIFTGHGI